MATPVAFSIACASSPKKAKASRKVVVEAMIRQVMAVLIYFDPYLILTAKLDKRSLIFILLLLLFVWVHLRFEGVYGYFETF